MRDKLQLVSEFWGTWIKHKNNGGKWRDLTKFFDKYDKFEDALNQIKDFVIAPSRNLFDQEADAAIILDDSDKARKVKQKIKEAGMGVIFYDEFKSFKALKNIKNAYWFFYKGDINTLEFEKEKYVSVVGSRKTPISSKKWIEETVPSDKIVVSGLAYGADVLGHKVAMEKGQKIVVFPGVDIYKDPKQVDKNEITNYAMENGIILSDVFPGSKMYDKSIFLKRNKWMAQMVEKTYVVYFKGISGTLGQVLEVSRLGGVVVMPKEVFDDNKPFLLNHKSFKEILKGKYFVN